MTKEDDVVVRLAEIAAECAMPFIREAITSAASSLNLAIEKAIREKYAGRRVSKGTRERIALRNEVIRKALSDGTPANEIATKFCISVDHVRRVCRQGER